MTQQRHDFFGPIHKGLRLGSAQMLVRLGNVDWRNAQDAATLLGALKLYLQLAREHLEHEDAEIIPALRARAPALFASLDHDHADHHTTFAELATAITAVETSPASQRPAAGRDLYLRFSTYFGDDLLHMAREEIEALPLLQAHFSDDELMSMETHIIAAIEPQRLTEYYMLMLPGMAPAERAAFARYVRSAAPPEAFDHLFNVVAPMALTPADYRILSEELAMAA
jgi:hemerythrin-like domain-containing protein